MSWKQREQAIKKEKIAMLEEYMQEHGHSKGSMEDGDLYDFQERTRGVNVSDFGLFWTYLEAGVIE